MSREESEKYSSRELLREAITKLNAVSTDVAVIKNNHAYTKEKLSDHDKEIDRLKTTKNQQAGAIATVGFIGVGSLVAWLKHIFQ